MKRYLFVLVFFGLFISSNIFAQSKTKITITVEKDSIKIEELSKLLDDIKKLEKKWKFDVKIEFTQEQEKGIRFYPYLNGSTTLKYNGATTTENKLDYKTLEGFIK